MTEAESAQSADPAGVGQLVVTSDHPRGDDLVVVDISGEIDLLTTAALTEALRTALQRPTKVAILDLTRVRFLGSAGLSVLLSSAEAAKDNGVDLGLVAQDRVVLRPMEITGTSSAFTVFDSVDAADAPVGRGSPPPAQPRNKLGSK
jgi:anti-sigma B factor antagonist